MKQLKNEELRWVQINFNSLFLFFLTGICTGLVITFYKMGIDKFAKLVTGFLKNYGSSPMGKIIFISAFFIMASIIYFFTKVDPNIKGSGIPIIFGVLDKKFNVDWKKTLPMKFFTSIVTVGSGLTLGREGPSVQMGGLVGQAVHQIGKSVEERRVFVGASSGAGFAVAFNAPLSGIMFAVEEIYKKTNRKIFLSSSVTVFSAIIISNMFLGNHPTLENIPKIKALGLSAYSHIFFLGLLTGFSGVLYNKVIIGGKKYGEKIKINPFVKFVIPFLVTAIFLLMDINLFGSGEHFIFYPLSQNAEPLRLIYYYFMKLFLLAIIFAVGCPGGSLVPLLAMGSLVGNIYGSILAGAGIITPDLILTFSILGMCGQFSSIVRAPLTGIVLILEMTGGSFDYLLAVAIVAMLSYTLAESLHSEPFYSHLYEMMVEKN